MLLQCRGRSSVSAHCPQLGSPQLGSSWARVTTRSAPCSLSSSSLWVTKVNRSNNQNGHLVARLNGHFEGEGAAFTREHKPKGVAFLWPAANWAVEAYVFHALMLAVPEDAFMCGRVGGFTQTSPHSLFFFFWENLAPWLQRAWRMVNQEALPSSPLPTQEHH